jgi:hypothetical protein
MLQVNTEICLVTSTVRHAMPQVQQQETMTFLCVTFMIFLIFNIILIIILTQQNQTTRQQDMHAEYALYVHLYTSHPHSHTVHCI